MKKIIAYVPAHMFYLLGDWTALLLNTGIFEARLRTIRYRTGEQLARFYQWSMRKSLALDNWGHCGIWQGEPINGEHKER